MTNHPGAETLLRLIDRDISPAEAPALQDHLSACGDCRDQFEAMQEALDDYDHFHRDLLKPSLPAPPREWAQLEFPDARTFADARRRTAHPMRWLAAAAAVAAIFVLFRRFQETPEVRASELLRQATTAEQTVRRRPAALRIHSGSRTLLRPARAGSSESGDAAALHAAFDQAGYSWDDPLSAAAFSNWRDRQPEKWDVIEESGGSVLIRTSSVGGAITEAALTLRAADLHPVACALRFQSSGETVEITEEPEPLPSVAPSSQAPARGGSSPAAAPAAGSATASAAAGPADELQVIAALHSIGADLGEPIEVRRDGASVIVSVTGLDESRRSRIRAALAGIATAQLRFEDVSTLPSDAPARLPQNVPAPEKTNPLIAELRPLLGPDVSASGLPDQFIDLTDRASERAFALRALALRFPSSAAAQLTAAGQDSLRSIVRDHASALAASMAEIHRLAAPVLPNAVPPGQSSGDWEALAEALPDQIEQLDRTLNGATDAGVSRKMQLAAGIAKLESVLRALSQP
jgi:hypothetical protein